MTRRAGDLCCTTYAKPASERPPASRLTDHAFVRLGAQSAHSAKSVPLRQLPAENVANASSVPLRQECHSAEFRRGLIGVAPI